MNFYHDYLLLCFDTTVYFFHYFGPTQGSILNSGKMESWFFIRYLIDDVQAKSELFFFLVNMSREWLSLSVF